MQFFTVIVSALAAAVATAAPTTSGKAAAVEERGVFDIAQFNNGRFGNVDFAYLSVINSLQLNTLSQLAVTNNLNLVGFQNVFNGAAFDLNTLLQLQQLVMLQQLQQLGILGGFDLATLQLAQLNLGLINNVGQVNLGQFVNPAVVGQVQTIITNAGVIVVA